MKAIKASLFVLLGIGLAVAFNSTAHTPCDDYSRLHCGYVQVINPYTGKLETQYVCK